MLILGTEPDQIAGVGEADDLAPAVGGHLVQGYCAGLDAKEMSSGIALSKNEFFGLDPAQRGLCKGPLETAGRALGAG